MEIYFLIMVEINAMRAKVTNYRGIFKISVAFLMFITHEKMDKTFSELIINE